MFIEGNERRSEREVSMSLRGLRLLIWPFPLRQTGGEKSNLPKSAKQQVTEKSHI